jgi:hypothetical protein
VLCGFSLGATTTAITSSAGQNLIINNTNIGSTANPYGMVMNLNGANATLTRSNLNTNANVTMPSVGASNPGILVSTFSSLTLQSSTINLVSSNASIEGISVLNAASLQFNNSQLNVTETLPGGGSVVIGIGVQNDSTAVINNGSNITVSANVPPTGPIVLGTISGFFSSVPAAPSSIIMNGGSVSVVANGLAPVIRIGPNIALINVACSLNG